MSTNFLLLSYLLTVSTLALGEFNIHQLPNQINGYLDRRTITPEFSETIELLKQRKRLKPQSKGLDMKLLDGKNEEQAKEVFNFVQQKSPVLFTSLSR
jgi:hypothetical protein